MEFKDRFYNTLKYESKIISYYSVSDSFGFFTRPGAHGFIRQQISE